MRSLTLLALSVGSTRGFAPPAAPASRRIASGPVAVATAPRRGGRGIGTRLHSTPEPLATEGDWSAFLDAEATGYVYYFNTVTGESSWEKPTPTFPAVDASSPSAGAVAVASSGDGDSREARKEKRRAERRKRREERKREQQPREEVSAAAVGDAGGGGGFFGGLFGGSNNKQAGEASQPPAKSKKEQLADLQEIASNDEFLSELDSVIAEAEEAIAIADKVEETPPADKVEEAPPANKSGGFTTSNFFSQWSSPKAAVEEAVVEEVAEPEEENVWVEGLKGLFQKTFNGFNPPKTTKTADQKVVAKETPKATQKSTPKAEVSDSDFLDVVWGAETSARPTLNIKEMMKAFQVTSKEEDPVAAAAEDEEFRTLALDMSLAVKAHPEKVSWGGEDAGFAAGRTFGVFDGVSGATKEKGKRLYSRSLAESMRKSSGRDGLTLQELTESMARAKDLADVEATGASTAVVGSVGEDNVLRALNLGDSVCLVLRDGAVAARTREIIHYFDCPYQLSDDSPDRPRDATSLSSEIFRGDVIVAGSDGVFDNLSDADVCGIVAGLGPKAKPVTIANKIVERSRAVSLDPGAVTPYSTVARGKRGYEMYKDGSGGKVDDVSCVVVKAS